RGRRGGGECVAWASPRRAREGSWELTGGAGTRKSRRSTGGPEPSRGGADLAGIAARKQRKHQRPTHTGGPFAQDTAAFHQRPLRFHRVGAGTCILAGTVATVGTKQAFGALGGADGGRVPRRHHASARHMPAPIWRSEERRVG